MKAALLVLALCACGPSYAPATCFIAAVGQVGASVSAACDASGVNCSPCPAQCAVGDLVGECRDE